MAHLAISLLGSFQMTLDDRPVTDWGTDKTRALLAYLVVEADRPHRRDVLAGLLWASSSHARARQSLRQALSHLRHAMGDHERPVPFLLIHRETVQFNPDCDHWLDVAKFAALSKANRTHRHRRPERCLPCLRRMEEMVDLYGGDFMGDFFLGDSVPFEEWAALQREHLQRQVMVALASLDEYHERRGDVGQAIQVARRQVRIQPWREEAHRRLMWLLALDGQRSAALAQYEICHRALAEELGVSPTAETTALHARIRDRELKPAPYRHNLPPAPTPFVGREVELAELTDLLADPDCRLVTLVGPGGVGKSRLALQVAADQVGLLAHGVALVPLAGLDSTDLLVPALADALRFRLHNQGDPEQQLLDFLRKKQLLLVLDNMEHVLEGGDLVSQILRHAPGVTLLVTSRERLSLREEWVYEVDGLTYPADPGADAVESFSAVALFVQTARRAYRRFLLAERERPYVARICQMVEGLPLAVELAAVCIPVRSCAEIAAGIERNLDVLETPLRNVPARHRSLRAAFEHSWDLLSTPERIALRRLSSFQGGFDEHAAEQVTDARSETLTALVNKSLLRRSASGRYEMHRLVQQYTAEKLQAAPQEQQAVATRHGDYYAGFLQKREPWFRGHRQAEALEAVAAEMENVGLAWRRAASSGNVEAIAGSLVSLGTFCAMRCWNREGLRAFGQAVDGLSRPRSDDAEVPMTRGRAIALGSCLAWQGHFAYQLGRYEEARQLLAQSLGVLPPEEKAFSLYTLAQVQCFGLNDYPEAARLFQQSLALYESRGDSFGRAQAVDGLGDVAARRGQHEEARRYYEEGLSLRREIGDRWGLSASLSSLGGLAGRLGEYDEAQRWFEESLAISRTLDDPRSIAANLHNLSTIAYLRKEYAKARRLRQETLAICREIGYRWGIASALKSLGDVAGRLGEYDEARRFLQESLTLLEEAGDRRSQAYTLNSLGTVAQAMGQGPESRRYFLRALEAAMEIREPALAMDVLISLARHEDADRALELLAFVQHHPASEQQTRDQIAPLRAELAHRVSAETAAAAETRGRSRELEEIVAEILDR